MNFNLGDFLKSLLDLTVFDYLRSVWGEAPWVEPVFDIIGVVAVSTFCLLIVLALIWIERKVIARMQDRVGPNRVGGKYGALQTVADALKLMTKEDLVPDGADKWAFNLAPILTVMAALLMWAVIPFSDNVIGANLNIGLFYILAVSSTSVVTLLLAGWGSNNKYALLGAFRAVAQLVSYEVPMVMSLLIPILLAGTMSTVGIVNAQDGSWFLWAAPLSALIFFISALAELGRTPFDLLEAESEIVAGFHVEYSGMKFALFFLAEFISTLFMSALFITIYMGGWHFFGLENMVTEGGLEIGRLFGLLSFALKTSFLYFVIVWVRGTLPRVRIDQLLDFNWKFLVPLVLSLILVVAIVEKSLPVDLSSGARTLAHLVSNLVIGGVVISILRNQGRKQREAQEAKRMAHRQARADMLDPVLPSTAVVDSHHAH